MIFNYQVLFNNIANLLCSSHKINDTGVDKFDAAPTDFFATKMKDIDGKEVDFSQYKGKYKAILCVNVATLCDLTNRDYP